MHSITEFKQHCIVDKGYPEKVIVVTSDKGSETELSASCKILVYETTIDPGMIVKLVSSLKYSVNCDYLVVKAPTFMNIFDMRGNEFTEIEEIPDFVMAPEMEEVAMAKQFKSILESIAHRFRGSYSYDMMAPVMDSLIAMAYQISKDGKWDKIAEFIMEYNNAMDAGEQYNDVHLTDFFKEIEYEIHQVRPKLKIDTTVIDGSEEFLFALYKLKNINFGMPNRCIAEVYRSFGQAENWMISQKLASLMMELAVQGGNIISADISAFLLESLRRDIEQNFSSMYINNRIELIQFLCGMDINVDTRSEFMKELYGSIILAMPFGIRYYEIPKSDKSLFGPKKVDLQFRILEGALNHLEKNGIVVALVSGAVLFQEHQLLEEMIGDRNVVAIIELDRPLKGSAIPAYLLIIRNGGNVPALISTEPVSVESYLDLAKDLKMHLKIQGGIEECVASKYRGSYNVLERQKFSKDSWLPTKIEAIDWKEDANCGVVELSEIAEVISGVTVPSSRYIGHEYFGGIPFLRISNMVGNEINLESCTKVPAEYAKVISKPGDIVFSTNGTIGKMALVKEGEVFVPSSQIVIIRCDRERCNPRALMELLQSKYLKDQIDYASNGATIRSIPKKAIQNLLIPAEEVRM